MNKITKEILFKLYLEDKRSVSFIANRFECSENRINYWLKKYDIQKRTISEAIYQWKNPKGDPFSLRLPINLEEGTLWGMGIGLYWGEGAKRGSGGLRITNTDPKMIKIFIRFLETFFLIDKKKLRFSIQIFNDISPQKALGYWINQLGVDRKQFYKTIISRVRGKGTYKYKSEYGVVVMYFNNVKLKRTMCELIEKNR